MCLLELAAVQQWLCKSLLLPWFIWAAVGSSHKFFTGLLELAVGSLPWILSYAAVAWLSVV